MTATRSAAAFFAVCVFVCVMNAFAAVDPTAHCYITIANGTCYYIPPAGYDCELGADQDPTHRGLRPCDSTGICYVPLAGDDEVCYYTPPYGYDCYYQLIPELIANMTHCDLIKANSAPEISFLSGSTTVNEDTDLLVDYIRIVDRDARENERDNKGYVRVTITGLLGKSYVSFQPSVLALPADRAAVTALLALPADQGGVQMADGSNGTKFVNVLDFQARMDPLAAVMMCLVFRPAHNVNGKVKIEIYVNDQGNTGGTAEQDTEDLEITVIAINDPPVATMATPAAADEDTQRTFYPATPLTVSDPDVNDEVLPANRVLRCDLSVTKGKIWVTRKLTATGAIQSPLVAGAVNIPSTTITMTSTLTDINLSLQTLVYLPNANENDVTAGGVETLVIYLDDGGHTGAGGAQHTTTNVPIHVTPVNDPPIIDAPIELEVDEDVSLPGTAFNITIDDVDTFSGLTLTLSVLHGTLTQTSMTGTLAQLNSFIKGTSYLGNQNFNGYDTLTVRVDDGGLNGVTVDTVRINVAAVNDPPTIWPDCPSLCVGSGYTGTVVMNSPGVFAVFDGSNDARPMFDLEDPDVGTSDLEILLEATTGVLKLSGSTSSLRFVVPQAYNAATGHDVMWIMGSRTALNAALAALRYEGTNGPTSNIVLAVNDQQHTGKGKAETDYFELPIP